MRQTRPLFIKDLDWVEYRKVKGEEYALYHYTLTDGDTVTSWTEYPIGERVEHFFSVLKNRPMIRPYKAKRIDK
jgi:hypothetical protein